MNTLRGVFPEPPPVQRRNFIKENMLHIKRMQGFVVDSAGDHTSFKKQSKQMENDATQKTMKLIRSTKRQLQNLSQISQGDKPKLIQNNQSAPPQRIISNKPYNQESYNSKTAVESLKDLERDRRKFREIGVQTELQHRHSYDFGTVKYPSPRSPEIRVLKSPQNLEMAGGDIHNRRRSESPDKTLSYDERHRKDYVRQNAQTQFSRPSISSKQSSNITYMTDPNRAPLTYQKGVVPKYIRDRREELTKHQTMTDERCPDGHVVLPETERKETLRMLRQSYSELVAELNQLPVRSDTLKIRNRKIEIENQLKKLDEGIKVFTRPKVYVKIGA